MGQLDNGRQDKKDGAKARKTQGRLSGRASEGGAIEWGAADARWVLAIVVEITKREGAAIFGCTRDGGALTVTLLLDGERETIYVKPGQDVDVEMAAIYEMLVALPD